MHPLTGVYAKLIRAKEHLDALQREFDEFVQLDPETPGAMALNLDFKAGEGVVTWTEDAPNPLRWAVVLGEFLYGLRSALDHLARQLVIVSGNLPTNQTEFPVFKDEVLFDEKSVVKTAGMSDPVRAAIRDLQPWHEWPENPEQTTLWRIHDLNIIDKHRILHLTDLWMFTIQLRLLWPVPGGTVIPEIKADPPKVPIRLQRDAVLVSFRWDVAKMRPFMESLGDQNVQVQVDASIDVGLAEGEWITDSGEPGAMQIRNLMQTSLDYMNTTLMPRFAPFFPDEAAGAQY